MYEKLNPMSDDIEEDHMLQTKIQFVTDDEWQYIAAKNAKMGK